MRRLLEKVSIHALRFVLSDPYAIGEAMAYEQGKRFRAVGKIGADGSFFLPAKNTKNHRKGKSCAILGENGLPFADGLLSGRSLIRIQSGAPAPSPNSPEDAIRMDAWASIQSGAAKHAR